MKKTFPAFLFCLAFLLLASSALAHKPSDSYLTMTVEGSTIRARWDIAIRDLDHALGLDADQDGSITWGELRARHPDVSAYALARFLITRRGDTCATHPPTHLVDEHSDGAYAVLEFVIQCPHQSGSLHLVYDLLFELDRLHRGLLRVEHHEGTQTFIFSPTNRSFTLDLGESSWWAEFQRFGTEGIWHIWKGFDHLLFLISLLLPSVLLLKHNTWQAMPAFRPALWEVVKIVTAFTLAHSLTLSLAVLKMISLPSRWVESTIAASVLLAALHNFYPVIRDRLWVVAFGFGLVHGLGFAAVLLDLGLTGDSLLPALGGFNVGVEAGQIAIVAVFFPLAFCARKTWWYQTFILRFGSFLIALVALGWLMERSWNLSIGLPF